MRDALRATAHATRNLSLDHPWVAALLNERPALGPNRIRNLEQSLAAVSGLGIDRDRTRSLLLAIDAYTIGATGMALAAEQMQRRDGLTDDEWRAAAQACFDRVTATGDLPHLRHAGNPARWRSDLSEEFDDGLNWLLAGFAESLSGAATTPPPHNGPTGH